jgi:hypothetical protein
MGVCWRVMLLMTQPLQLNTLLWLAVVAAVVLVVQ